MYVSNQVINKIQTSSHRSRSHKLPSYCTRQPENGLTSKKSPFLSHQLGRTNLPTVSWRLKQSTRLTSLLRTLLGVKEVYQRHVHMRDAENKESTCCSPRTSWRHQMLNHITTNPVGLHMAYIL